MAYLNRDSILNADDIKTMELEVPEWGGTVVLKMMNGKERDAFESSLVKNGKANVDNVRAKLVQATVIDPETKELMFSVADIEALGKKSASALTKVFAASQKLSRITESDVEELTKN